MLLMSRVYIKYNKHDIVDPWYTLMFMLFLIVDLCVFISVNCFLPQSKQPIKTSQGMLDALESDDEFDNEDSDFSNDSDLDALNAGMNKRDLGDDDNKDSELSGSGNIEDTDGSSLHSLPPYTIHDGQALLLLSLMLMLVLIGN